MMVAMKFSVFAFASLAAAAPSPAPAENPTQGLAIDKAKGIESVIKSLFPSGTLLTPQILSTFLEPNTVNLARNTHITRDGTTLKLMGEKYTTDGANVYWLGLDENVIPEAGKPFYAPFNASYPTKGRVTEIMNTMNMMGMKLIRSQTLGISVGNPLSLEPTLGVWNEAAFESIDWAVWQARQHGLRIIAPLIDNYDYYHGGKFQFLRWRGFNVTSGSPEVMEFYTNPLIIGDFKQYIEKLITHVNPYTGISYAQDPTIMAYETGNELGGPNFGDKWVPNSWTKEICQTIKKFGPQKLCVDGTSGVNSTHAAVEEIDIFSDHFYPLNVTKLDEGVQLASKANRVYLAGEIDWTGLNGGNNPGDSLQKFNDYIQKAQTKDSYTVAGSLIWSLFGRNVPDCSKYVQHNDGFTMHYNSPENTAMNKSQISLVRQHNFARQGIEVDAYTPAVACPHNYIPGYEAQYTTI